MAVKRRLFGGKMIDGQGLRLESSDSRLLTT